MKMFGISGTTVKGFEKKYLDSKNTGMTIDDFEQKHLRNTVHAYYMVQKLTVAAFARFQDEAVEKANTPEGDEATMSAGFLVGICDALNNDSYAFSVIDDMKRKQVEGWSFLIGDQSRQLVAAVECLNEYAHARKVKPAEVLARFPREEFEQAFAEYEATHAE